MAKIIWNQAPRRSEYGLDRGVFYQEIAPGEFSKGVFWNGLISLVEENNGSSVASYYYDGIKYLNEPGAKDFSAKITAYMSPIPLEEANGDVSITPGVILTRQKKKPFGLSYRTMYEDGENYKIHLIYNALIVPESAEYKTLSDSPDTAIFSWKISAVPVRVDNHAPSPHFVLDSKKIRPDKFKILETLLYGTEKTEPRLPTIGELNDMIIGWTPLYIIPDSSTGLAELIDRFGDLHTTTMPGLNRSLIQTRLFNSGFPGLYRLE